MTAPRANRRLRLAVAGLLGAHVALGLSATLRKSTTADEIAHLTAGYTYWRAGDYRFQPENGILPQRWCALPLLVLRPRLPTRDQQAWRGSNVWVYGDQFFHEMGNHPDQLLFWGRAAIALLSALLCLVIFAWSRSLFGVAGGMFSLVLAAFSPTLLAHGFLATSDLCASLFFTLSVWSLWLLVERITLPRIAEAALAVGALLLSKYSAVLILPIAGLLALFAILRPAGMTVKLPRCGLHHVRGRLSKLLLLGALGAGIAAGSVVVIWLGYGFRYRAAFDASEEHAFYRSEMVDQVRESASGRTAQFLAGHRLLPEGWLYGFLYVVATQQRFAFFNGEYSVVGWLAYFPYCLMVKTPLPLFGLLGLSALAIRKRCGGAPPTMASRDATSPATDRIALTNLFPLAAWLIVYWAASLATSLNIGHRHLLPTYPVMFIFAGAAALPALQSVKGLLMVGGLLGWFVLESVLTYPHYLAYFNPLVGSENAYRHLVDSNLDWGQDLPGLKQWLDEHATPGMPVYVDCFGAGRPESYGITAARLRPRTFAEKAPLRGGLYCISATALQAVYPPYPGRWIEDYESRYREVSQKLRELAGLTVDEAMLRLDAEGIDFSQLMQAHDELSSRRMLAYLRGQRPLAQVCYSILIYSLTDQDVERALAGPPAELYPNEASPVGKLSSRSALEGLDRKR